MKTHNTYYEKQTLFKKLQSMIRKPSLFCYLMAP